MNNRVTISQIADRMNMMNETLRYHIRRGTFITGNGERPFTIAEYEANDFVAWFDREDWVRGVHYPGFGRTEPTRIGSRTLSIRLGMSQGGLMHYFRDHHFTTLEQVNNYGYTISATEAEHFVLWHKNRRMNEMYQGLPRTCNYE